MTSPRLSIVLVLLLALVGACDSGPELSVPARAAEDAWEALQKEHTEAAYFLFLRSNRMAARAHGEPHDEAGIRYQVRALEAQAAEAERTNDETLAVEVQGRLDEIIAAGFLEIYDEELPGSRERLEAAHAKATRVLGE